MDKREAFGPILLIPKASLQGFSRASGPPCVCDSEWFGPTMLHHFRQLDWGFRVGGQVINVRMGAQIVSALALASLSVTPSSTRRRGRGAESPEYHTPPTR